MSMTDDPAPSHGRRIEPLPLPDGVLPNLVTSPAPMMIEVEPGNLFIDERYQRDLSPASYRLVMRIVQGFDWRRFKPPVVTARAGQPGTFDVIDGQHTAIAAASHGGIGLLPCQLIEAGNVQDRAQAFIGHNRDRVGMAATQLHHAAVAAGDADAVAVQQACELAGVRLLRLPPSKGQFRPGDCMAVGVITAMVRARGVRRTAQVLALAREAGMAPVAANAIRAIDEVLHGRDYAGEIDPDRLQPAIVDLARHERKVAELAAAKRLPLWRAMVIVLYQNAPKLRPKLPATPAATAHVADGAPVAQAAPRPPAPLSPAARDAHALIKAAATAIPAPNFGRSKPHG